MDNARVPGQHASPIERLIERTIFGGRWLLMPFSLGLILGLAALLAKFALQLVNLLGLLSRRGARRRLRMRRPSCTVAQAGSGQTRINRERRKRCRTSRNRIWTLFG